MEIKICANCEFCWESIEDIDSKRREPCPECNSTVRKFNMECHETIQTHEAYNMKIKDPSLPSKKKVRVEVFDGHQWSVKLEKFINKVQIVDKRNNLYFKKIVDPDTGEIITERSEPLDQHQGHGYAKFKKDKEIIHSKSKE